MIKDRLANQSKANAVFKPTPAQVKGDATTRAARAIIDQEASARDAKTARLREARLARDAALEAEPKAAPAPKRPAAKPRAKKARSPA